MTTTDARVSAQTKLDELVTLLRAQGADERVPGLIDECGALKRAIAAFHLEAIRFRMFNVDRQLGKMSAAPPDAPRLFEEVRAALEAAGFHTRSH